MVEYKGVVINLEEALKFEEIGFSVSTEGGLIFKAESKFGKSFSGKSGEDALQGAKKQIDDATK